MITDSVLNFQQSGSHHFGEWNVGTFQIFSMETEIDVIQVQISIRPGWI